MESELQKTQSHENAKKAGKSKTGNKNSKLNNQNNPKNKVTQTAEGSHIDAYKIPQRRCESKENLYDSQEELREKERKTGAIRKEGKWSLPPIQLLKRNKATTDCSNWREETTASKNGLLVKQYEQSIHDADTDEEIIPPFENNILIRRPTHHVAPMQSITNQFSNIRIHNQMVPTYQGRPMILKELQPNYNQSNLSPTSLSTSIGNRQPIKYCYIPSGSCTPPMWEDELSLDPWKGEHFEEIPIDDDFYQNCDPTPSSNDDLPSIE